MQIERFTLQAAVELATTARYRQSSAKQIPLNSLGAPSGARFNLAGLAMENNATFQYLKLILENISLWQLLAIAIAIWLMSNRSMVAEIPRHVSRFKIGDIEIELKELKDKLRDTEVEVEALESELERERLRFEEILSSFNAHAPVPELSAVRQSLKAVAGTLEDLAPVMKGMEPGASPENLYAAAEVLRTRRDPAHFDKLVGTLDRLAKDPRLEGIRLHTVWTLTSALHKTLIADIKNNKNPSLSSAQLQRAQDALRRLNNNPRVLADRPEDPMKGVRGPAKWANEWIERRLKALA
ncbi:hypothetical protein ACFMBG_07165 [Leisingera sp. D0M16]|uniref:hypothetical protein n=1 Tax=Leisingera coralii TaxID=3351347 RepID=UPI003B7A750C